MMIISYHKKNYLNNFIMFMCMYGGFVSTIILIGGLVTEGRQGRMRIRVGLGWLALWCLAGGSSWFFYVRF